MCRRGGYLYDQTITFYLTNFFNGLRVWRMFAKWGRLADVYLPQKRNKASKPFGFVRFKEVAKPMEMALRHKCITTSMFYMWKR